MPTRKGKSKRVGMKMRYNIQKKVKAHAKKLKKFAKKNPHLTHKKSKRDPGIPNLWPLKDSLLKKVMQHKEAAEEMKIKQKAARKKMLDKKRRQAAQPDEVDQEFNSFQKPQQSLEVKHYENEVAKRRWYFREMKKVIEAADVIMEVLDARDPMGCRSKEIETMIQSQLAVDGQTPKKVILILNKIDLVPPDIVAKWVKYLKREFPTLAFKASTQQKGTVGHVSGKASQADTSLSGCVGGSALLELLKNYCRLKNTKQKITVGIIGYPNVGKSSIINSLKRQRVVGVGSTPGFTKTIQQVKLDSNINLLDSPGVLLSAGKEDENLVLRNCIRVEQMEDPVGAVEALVKRCTVEQLCTIYKIAAFKTPAEFISHVAHRRGKLGKGGIVNFKSAARCVIKDWNEGVIPFYSVPPEIQREDNVILSSFSEAFDINSILDKSNEGANEAFTGVHRGTSFMTFGATAAASDASGMDTGAGDDSAMGDADEEVKTNTMRGYSRPAAAKPAAVPKKARKKLKAADENNQQRNQDMAKMKKKLKKQQRRQARMDAPAYDFDEIGDEQW